MPSFLLLIENNSTDAYLLIELLKADQQPWQIVHAKRLSHAIEHLNHNQFEVILLNPSLPDSEGFDSITNLRAVARDQPIVVLTEPDHQQLAAEAITKGAQDYLVKGQITIDSLTRSISYAIEQKRVLQQIQENERLTLQALEKERLLEILSALSYRSGDLQAYLHEITVGVSHLLQLDWAVVTLCQNGFERVMASNIDFDGMNELIPLHGSLTNTVVTTGQTLAVEDVRRTPDYGTPPDGYLCYLGVPLRTAQGEAIGTICCFNHAPRSFTPQDIRIGELFAERAATSIDNYHLFQKQLQFNEVLEQEVLARTQELREAQAKLVERERLAAIGEFAAMIVHEIRNPLTTIVMGIKYAQKKLLDESAQARFSLSLSEADRLERLLSEILIYAKPQVLHLEEFEVNTFIHELLIPLREMTEAQGRQIEFIPTSAVKIQGDRDKLKQVFINIVRNACEAVPTGEMIQWKISPLESGQICISVQNAGDPIPPAVLAKLTTPFYSTKPEGTGLGLAISKRIVNAHQGELSIQSEATIGTVVSVQLPAIA
jgi:signal transduction histidine kinase/DNA-binding NarL/FixJ family response regulator